MLTRNLGGVGATMAGAALLSMLLASVFGKLGRGRRERRQLAPFLSPEVLREIRRHPETVDLTPHRRLITVLSSDLRGVTALAEMLEPPSVAEMLCDYLTEVTEVVFKYGGTLASCAGDTLIALYNAPLEDAAHAANAVRTALELQERTLQVSARWQTRLGATIRPGIGIATGEAVVGTMGPATRPAYTAVGATVDLAGRLQALTREHGVGIVISEPTRGGLDSEFLTRRLGEVTGRGAAASVVIHGVLPADIRKQPRAVLEVAATLVLLGAGQTCLVTTRDVSEGGMALGGVPLGWSVGTRVEVRCEGGLLPVPLLAEAIIAWRRGDEAGISFAELDPQAAPTVAEYVATRPRR
ncbi:MAG TPA: adenylate/guanylate cyclase domain-containing protein [Methylomirabilota bacterium]|jgi:class 3 adenylate cyclase|nr:adenylate/guanylate cyclase domain-containing protein [Methylomirabilota bacterium]